MMKTQSNIFSQKIKVKKGSLLSVVSLIAVSLAFIVTLTACSSNNNSGGTGNNNATINPTSDNGAKDSQAVKKNESLVITTSEVSETATFYPVTVGDIKMEVLAVKAPDGTIRTAFNTCQVCNGSPKAYFEQKGDVLQCQNCGNEFSMDRVEVEAGGCNPVPIFDENKTTKDGSITVPYETLETNAYRFPANWKSA